jgi:DNA polymerase-3 subunit epsilon
LSRTRRGWIDSIHAGDRLRHRNHGPESGGGDRIVEIGCVEIYNRVETGRSFHAYFNPDRDMPFEPGSARPHNLFLSDKPRFRSSRTSCSTSSRIRRSSRTMRRSISASSTLSSSAAESRRQHEPDGGHFALARTNIRGQAQPRRSVHAVRSRPKPADQARRAARRAASRAGLCRADRRAPDRAWLVADTERWRARISRGRVRELRPARPHFAHARNLSVTARLLPSSSTRFGHGSPRLVDGSFGRS